MPENLTRVNAQEPGNAAGRADGTVLVYATFPNLAAAEAIAGDLVEVGLAACANLFPGMRSIYRWQGAVEREEEVAAIFKTRAELASRVIGWLRIEHPYVNPAAVVLPVVGGAEAFLDWIAIETERAGST